MSSIDRQTVRRAYAWWAPVYDVAFGAVATAGRKQAVSLVNGHVGKVLEVGVGTGLSLPLYGPDAEITAIDLSTEMLEKARRRAANLDNMRGILEMDAAQLAFADGEFDTVVAMYVMTAVPDPHGVWRELERVCAPGGQLIVVNHVARESGPMAVAERLFAPACRLMGWNSDLTADVLFGDSKLRLLEQRTVGPLGLFTLWRYRKEVAVMDGTIPRALPGG